MHTETTNKAAAPPSDPRWKLLDAAMRRAGRKPSALIESAAHGAGGVRLSRRDALRYVAAALRVPLSKVYGVATFYHFFTLKPQGEHTCVVCMGTACYIKGARQIARRAGGDVRREGRRDDRGRQAVGADGALHRLVRSGAGRRL